MGFRGFRGWLVFKGLGSVQGSFQGSFQGSADSSINAIIGIIGIIGIINTPSEFLNLNT
jgi:hypothetical protein